MKILTAFLLLFSVAGCITTTLVSKDYCENLNLNIEKQGFVNALKGQPLRNFNKTLIKCASYEIVLDRSKYEAGWNKGLKFFCTSEKGYKRGVSGKQSHDVCSLEEYKKGWKKGVKILCTSKKGYEWGAGGRKKPNICPKSSAVKFAKGWTRGLKIFCTHDKGYELGLRGQPNPQVCLHSPQFSVGYVSGVKQYEENKKHRSLIKLEEQRLRVERQRIEDEQRQRERLIDLQEKRLEETIKLQKLGGKSLCRFDSDCGEGGDCRYNYRLRDRVCRYD